MMQKVIVIDPGDTTLLQDEKIDKSYFMKINDAIFEQKVVIEIGDSKKFVQGQLITQRELRDENSSLRRSDKNLVKVRDAEAAVSNQLYKVLPVHH